MLSRLGLASMCANSRSGRKARHNVRRQRARPVLTAIVAREGARASCTRRIATHHNAPTRRCMSGGPAVGCWFLASSAAMLAAPVTTRLWLRLGLASKHAKRALARISVHHRRPWPLESRQSAALRPATMLAGRPTLHCSPSQEPWPAGGKPCLEIGNLFPARSRGSLCDITSLSYTFCFNSRRAAHSTAASEGAAVW